MTKQIMMTLGLGSTIALIGIAIRLAARELTPTLNESWSPGDWLRTSSAYWECAWSDIGSALLLGGMMIVGFALFAWCRK